MHYRLRRRIHIPVAFWIALTAALSLVCFASARAQDLVLPNYVGENATTTALFTNLADHQVKFPDSFSCTPLGCTPVKGPTLDPGASLRVAVPAPKNGTAGLYHVTPPDPYVLVQSEIVTGAKALFRVGAMPPLDTARFNLAVPAGPWNGFVFIGATAPTVVSFYGQTVELDKDDAVILSPPADGNFTILSQLGAHIYTFAGINSSTNGSLQLVSPR